MGILFDSEIDYVVWMTQYFCMKFRRVILQPWFYEDMMCGKWPWGIRSHFCKLTDIWAD
jgi:hypothetical protein